LYKALLTRWLVLVLATSRRASLRKCPPVDYIRAARGYIKDSEDDGDYFPEEDPDDDIDDEVEILGDVEEPPVDRRDSVTAGMSPHIFIDTEVAACSGAAVALA
jgi:hypothetical protein